MTPGISSVKAEFFAERIMVGPIGFMEHCRRRPTAAACIEGCDRMEELPVDVDEEMLSGADPEGLFLCALQPYPYMMTPDHISEFIGVSSQEVRRLLCDGRMRGCRVGNRWFVPKLALLRYLHRPPQETISEEEQQDEAIEVR